MEVARPGMWARWRRGRGGAAGGVLGPGFQRGGRGTPFAAAPAAPGGARGSGCRCSGRGRAAERGRAEGLAGGEESAGDTGGLPSARRAGDSGRSRPGQRRSRTGAHGRGRRLLARGRASSRSPRPAAHSAAPVSLETAGGRPGPSGQVPATAAASCPPPRARLPSRRRGRAPPSGLRVLLLFFAGSRGLLVSPPQLSGPRLWCRGAWVSAGLVLGGARAPPRTVMGVGCRVSLCDEGGS